MNDIATLSRSEGLPANAPGLTPMEMMDRAIASGAGVEVLEKLMGLQERFEKNQARKAFDAAISAAKAEIPVIAKTKQVGFESRRAGAARTDYKHETLDEIARVVTPILGKYGLSYRFRTTSNLNEPVTVTCIISHRDGHSEENTLCAGRDDSGNKNSIQAIGSTVTYLQRYTLKAALGLAAAADDDARKADDEGTVTAEQAAKLRKLIDDFDLEKPFKKFFKVENVEDLPASLYERAVYELNTLGAEQRGVKA